MKKKWIIGGVIGVVLVILVAFSITVVGVGCTGILITAGKVSEKTLGEGTHLHIPLIQTVIQISNRTQKVEVSTGAASKDLQSVLCDVAVNYSIEKVNTVSLYRNIGTDYEAIIIIPSISESIKAITAKYTAEELIASRQSISDEIKAKLAEKVTEYGVTVQLFNITNFEFSEEFDAAVEAKQTAEQEALKAEQDLKRVQIEAQQKVIQAEAEAKSIQLVQEALSMAPEYVEYIKWSKWNGELPKVYSSGDDRLIVNYDE